MCWEKVFIPTHPIFVSGVGLIYIVIGPITVDKIIPEHHDKNRRSQGKILGQEIGGKNRNRERQTLENIEKERFAKLQDGNPDGQPHYTCDGKLNELG